MRAVPMRPCEPVRATCMGAPEVGWRGPGRTARRPSKLRSAASFTTGRRPRPTRPRHLSRPCGETELPVKQLFDEFKEFITKGNLVEIAVAFVVGTAFAAVTLAFNKGIVMAFIAAVF
ncbi:MAG: MscL family protein, partial [Acidimicrobiales bacterium]